MAKVPTAKAVEKMLPNPERCLEIPDGLLPGLDLVVQPSGAKSWAVRFRANGKTAKMTLGRFPAIELAKARELARNQFEAATASAWAAVSLSFSLPMSDLPLISSASPPGADGISEHAYSP